MRKCSNDCTPCCDFCIHVYHEYIGGDVDIKFIFKWGDEDKSFNVRFGTDRYAEEQ